MVKLAVLLPPSLKQEQEQEQQQEEQEKMQEREQQQKRDKMQQETAIFLTLNAMASDKLACLIALCDTVRGLIDVWDNKVVLYVDVSTAITDFSIPRFRRGREMMMLVPAQGHNVNGADDEVQIDSRMLQAYHMTLFQHILSEIGGLSPYVESGRCEVVFIEGELTPQGFWEPIVPRTFLFYDAQTRRMRNAAEVEQALNHLEQQEQQQWAGYIPDNDPGKHRLTQEEARVSLDTCNAMDALRNAIRDHIRDEIMAMRTMIKTTTAAAIDECFTPWSGVVERLRKGAAQDTVLFVTCAACVRTRAAYAAVKESPGGADRIRGVYLQMLSLDTRDDIRGRQFNESLAPQDTDAFLKQIQEDGVYVFAVPTQVCKRELARYANTNVETAAPTVDLIGEAAHEMQKKYNQFLQSPSPSSPLSSSQSSPSSSPSSPSSSSQSPLSSSTSSSRQQQQQEEQKDGFSLAMYHATWNECVGRRAPIFDVLCAWALYHDVVCGDLHLHMDLLTVTWRDEGVLMPKASSFLYWRQQEEEEVRRNNNSFICIPNLFKRLHFCPHSGRPLLTSPFTGKQAAEAWYCYVASLYAQ
eukprot:3939706-Rhodomonas_salina.1